MSKDVSFAMDTTGGQEILTMLAMPTIKAAGAAIAARANSMAQSQTSRPPNITMTTQVGTIRRGIRAIAKITSEGHDAHSNYIGAMALAKAKDAGRV